MPVGLMHQRTLQVCLLLAVALLFSRVPQWEHGAWVLISVGAIIGPFSPLLTFRKSMLRALGTTAGLLLSVVVIATISHLSWIIPILGVVLAYGIAFTSQQDYRYFIMIVTVAIALNFADTYVPFTSFEPLSFFVSRAMGVFVGIAAYVTHEWFVFGRKGFVQWVDANNNELEEKLTTIIAKLNSLHASDLVLILPLLAEISRAQATHAQSVPDMASELDETAWSRAQQLQRISQRLQMSVYRALSMPTKRDASLQTRMRRIEVLLKPRQA